MQKNFALRGCGSSASTNSAACVPPDNADQTADRILESIYRRERNDLLRYLNRQVGHDLAPDIAQEVFLRAYISRQLPHLVNPGRFLHRIARNILIDHARRSKCRPTPMPLREVSDSPCSAMQEQELGAQDLRISIERALASLPEKTRTIFLMHRTDEMAYRDIHRELDISIGAVEYHMMKALAHLRAALEPSVNSADCAEVGILR